MHQQEPTPPVESAEPTESLLEPDAAAAGSAAEEKEPVSLELMEQRVGEATKKAEENWDRFVRAQAEIENVRRRAEKDLQNAHKFALERFAKELLAVVDSLELGLQAASGEEAQTGGLREGMELTLKQLCAALERFDIKPVDPQGERFNPEFHQAMATEPTTDAEPNTVVRVFQKGYLLHDRLLRPALVVVAQPVASPVGGQA
ncbi:MAG: nucleotide exchange factor GrpE [Gammaproteobacteria bacterium]|nr:nucleotide exchange factor GrpE [Gammaproteobacteria bacterium]